MPIGESKEGPDLPIQISQHLMVSVNESHTLLIGGKTSEFNATKGPFIYYVSICIGGLENGNFCLRSHYEKKLTKNIRLCKYTLLFCKFLPPKRRKTLRSY